MKNDKTISVEMKSNPFDFTFALHEQQKIDIQNYYKSIQEMSIQKMKNDIDIAESIVNTKSSILQDQTKTNLYINILKAIIALVILLYIL